MSFANNSKLVVAISGIVLLFCVSACSRFGGGSSFDEGSSLFAVQCSGCHGRDGLATSPAAKNLGLESLRSPEVLKMSDDDLFEIIATGSKNMPSYRKSLGEQKIRAILFFLRHPLPRE